MSTPKNIVIIGATSAVAQETAKLFAAKNHNLFLVARNADKLAMVQADLKVRGQGQVYTDTFDHKDYTQHQTLVGKIKNQLTTIDFVLVAHGSLPDQAVCEKDFSAALEVMEINFLSVISFLTGFANVLELQGSGTIGAISSVAGDRGRKSNYIYGSAKGALSVFLEGLRNRLYSKGVNVLVIKPGFIDSPMTAHFKKGALWASPQKIAKGIVCSYERQCGIVYLPCFWKPIMCIIKAIPDFIFKRLSL